MLYAKGEGIAQDYDKAREWYQKAADAGIASAMTNLGLMYDNGQGITQDYDKALLCYLCPEPAPTFGVRRRVVLALALALTLTLTGWSTRDTIDRWECHPQVLR